MNSYKIISVESRKGGVGKTTAALNLSTALIKKGYKILLLDVDITGTSISGSYNSSYWKELIFPVKKNNKEINLLELFSKTFLKGNNINSFSKDHNNREKYIVSKDKINIISSEIFSPNIKEKGCSELICDPRILFDELHSFWLIDMLKQLCEDFAKCMMHEKVIIILDNSPGYIGLGKSVHEWLTDIGPQNGKFLTVSSFDIQDLDSCFCAIQEIDELIDIKISGANYYQALKANSNQIQKYVPKEIEKFFLKLATVENNEQYSYYRNQNESKPSLDSYQSIVINKAPRELSSRNFYYSYNNLPNYDDKKRRIYDTFLNERKMSENVVYFENDIHTQFIEPSIRKKDRYEREYNSSLKGYFTLIENKSISNQNNLPNTNLIKQITAYQDQLNKLLSKLSLCGFSNITNLVEKRWMPETPFIELQQAFEFSITALDPHLYEEFYDYKDPDEKINDLNNNLTNKLFERIFKVIKENDIVYLNMGVTNELYVRSLLGYITHSFDLRTHEIDFLIDYIASIIGFILKLQTERIKIHRDSNKTFAISSFLASENITHKELKKSIEHMHYRHEKNIHQLNRLFRDDENNFLADLYNSFCHAQARLIDLNYDFRFLVVVLREVSINNNKENILYPNIKDIVDKVIISKQVPHYMAEKELNQSLYRVKEMGEFQKVIEGIIKKWGLYEI